MPYHLFIPVLGYEASEVFRVRGETWPSIAHIAHPQRQTASYFGVCSGTAEICGRKGRRVMLPKKRERAVREE